MADYDIITVGGGLAGSSLASVMAEKGYRVLVVERETEFKDRVRGEGMTAWGAVEAEELGIGGALSSGGARECVYWQIHAGPVAMPPRDIGETTPHGKNGLNFYHPDVQEALIIAAEEAGAEVRRGARVRSLEPGSEPSVHVEWDGGSEKATARIVVGADGRSSMVRKWAGFESQQEPPGNQIAGVLLEGATAEPDRVMLCLNPFVSQLAIYFPQGAGRGRGYLASRADSGLQLAGDSAMPRFFEESVRVGFPEEKLAGAKQAGPLATFQGADSWVEHPYREGVALIGDAAATTDPTWGQGLSLTLRDVRALRDALLGEDDWDAGGHRYASDHDGYYGPLRECESMFTFLFMQPGSEADAARGRVLPQLAMEPMFLPDTFMAGPDLAPVTEEDRKKIYGS